MTVADVYNRREEARGSSTRAVGRRGRTGASAQSSAATKPHRKGVVIVGCGSQAARHLTCLAKLQTDLGVHVVALVDPNPAGLEKCRRQVESLNLVRSPVVAVGSLAEAAQRLDMRESLVDVVTPNHLHYEIAEQAVELGARRIMVEKPLAHTLTDARRFLQLEGQVCVLENYLFSEVTAGMCRLVEERQWRPAFIKSEFSKDRRADSSMGRGLGPKYVPHVFSVEIPHQVAIAARILGSVGQVADAWDHDMILRDGRIAGHGEGALTLLHDNGVFSYNFSCLQGFRHLGTSYRSVKVYCGDNIKVFGFYSTTVDLEGAVLAYKGSRLIHRESIHDDSLKNSLRHALECFAEERELLTDVRFGVDVLRVIEHGRRAAAAMP